jgi:hypothetical protein
MLQIISKLVTAIIIIWSVNGQVFADDIQESDKLSFDFT